MSLSNEITKRAESSSDVPESDPLFFKKWAQHWFATAEAFRDEAAAEGLSETAASIQHVIDEQRRYA